MVANGTFSTNKYTNLSLRNVDEIKSTKLNSYFSFMQGAKSVNSELF